MKIKMIVTLDYEPEIMHGDDNDAENWFLHDVLLSTRGDLELWSKEIGDSVGKIEVVEVLESEA